MHSDLNTSILLHWLGSDFRKIVLFSFHLILRRMLNFTSLVNYVHTVLTVSLHWFILYRRILDMPVCICAEKHLAKFITGEINKLYTEKVTLQHHLMFSSWRVTIDEYQHLGASLIVIVLNWTNKFCFYLSALSGIKVVLFRGQPLISCALPSPWYNLSDFVNNYTFHLKFL